jgi:predicted phage terminase large subunit-like protein
VDLSDGSLESQSSYNCFLIIGIIGAKIYVLDIVMEKMSFPDQVKTFIKLREEWKTSFQLVEELSNGRALCDFIEREYNVQNILRIQPKEYGGDKFTRFSTTLPRFALNHIWLPHHTIHAKSKICADQLITFPKGINDDFVDALSQAINYVEKNEIRKGGGGKDYVVDVNDDYRDNPFSATGLSDIMSENNVSLSDVRGLF